MPEREFTFRVVSPLGTVFNGKARGVTLTTKDGEITVLSGHMPMVSVLVDGEIRIRTAEKEVWIAVAGGFLETAGTGESEVTVLSDFAAESDSIEVARVEAAKARAEQLLAEKKERGELLLVERDLQRAILQLKVAQRIRTRRRDQ
ncbi:MAG TPA: ATP synthase F1 subunit epsilon [Spirochaetia bacterium]|nr:ATP synthase F1 subunit epsilon [Spirochaetia bacterium]HTZ50086.1 ATP synthase F1 subunit epsilon [Spirochaetia bacterium]